MTLEELERELAKLREAGVPGNTQVKLIIDCKRYAHSKRRTLISYWLSRVYRTVVLTNSALKQPKSLKIWLEGSGVKPAYDDPMADLWEKDGD